MSFVVLYYTYCWVRKKHATSVGRAASTGCPISKFPLCFCHFGTCHLEINILLLQSQKNNFGFTGANFDINYLSYFLMNFKNSCAYLVANFLKFSKLPQLLQLG